MGKDSVKVVLNGGGSLSVELIKDATKYFPRAKLFLAYGMKETCLSLTFMTIYDPTLDTPNQLPETVGKAKCNSVHQPQGVCVATIYALMDLLMLEEFWQEVFM